MEFKLRIQMDNSAFDVVPCLELARCLKNVATMLERSGDTTDFAQYRNIFDINGNIVGQFAVKSE